MRTLLAATLALIVLLGVVAGGVGAPTAPATAADTASYAPGELIVGLLDTGRTGAVDAALTAAGATIKRALPSGDALLLAVPVGGEAATAEALRRTGRFRYVERSRLIRRPPLPAAPMLALPLGSVQTLAIFDDPYFNLQWALTKIRAPEAWEISTGSPSVKVCVVDSGYDVGHPDQPANFQAQHDYVDGGVVTRDGNGHGTHVSGIIAARTNNGVGVASLAPNVTLLSYRVLDDTGSGRVVDSADAARAGADAGCRVINLSLGGEGSPQDTYEEDAMNYAASKGALVVAAAGNCGAGGSGCSGVNPIEYPAAYSSVMAVGATSQADEIADFSTRHLYVSVSAPGVRVLSTYSREAGGSYAYVSGTSQATPYVAALAGLIFSIRPDLTLSQVRSIVEASAVDLGTPGKDDAFGYGRIDAAAALAAARAFGQATPTATSTPSPTPTSTPTPTPAPTQIAIDTTGGRLQSNDADRSTAIDVPAGAVTTTTTLTYAYAAATPPAGLAATRYGFTVTASQSGTFMTTLPLPYTITVGYSAGRGPVREDSLGLYRQIDASQWSTTGITTTLVTGTQSLIAATHDLGRFAVFGTTYQDALPIVGGSFVAGW